MNHKRRRPKHQRAGCLMCKPHKDTPTRRNSGDQGKRFLVEKLARREMVDGRAVLGHVVDRVEEAW